MTFSCCCQSHRDKIWVIELVYNTVSPKIWFKLGTFKDEWSFFLKC